MESTWFILVASMIVAYAVLDGFDLGAGILHWLIARTDTDRRTILRSIGPVWDGNEVWLIAGGGTPYFAFPAFYARQLQWLLPTDSVRARWYRDFLLQCEIDQGLAWHLDLVSL